MIDGWLDEWIGGSGGGSGSGRTSHHELLFPSSGSIQEFEGVMAKRLAERTEL
jgi:hypothetical protein